MAKIEGFRGFFKGNGASVAKIAPFSALEFYFYALFKNQLYPQKEKLCNSEKLVAGCLTGGLAQAIIYPIDLIKTYLIINVEAGQKIGMVQQGNMIYK